MLSEHILISVGGRLVMPAACTPEVVSQGVSGVLENVVA